MTKFVNALMRDGKKSTAEAIFYDAMQIVEERMGQPALNVYRQALSNTKPVLEVKSRRVGGATYQVPVEVRPRRREALARRWLVDGGPRAGREDDGRAPRRRVDGRGEG